MKKLKKLFHRIIAFIAIVMLVTSNCVLDLSNTTFAEETDLYLDFNVNDLPYTEQYYALLYELKRENYTDNELATMVTKFFSKHPDDKNEQAVMKGMGNVIYDFVAKLGVGVYAPYYYGKVHLWDTLTEEDRRGKTLVGSPFINLNVSQATNDAEFNHLKVNYAKTQPVVLTLYERGVTYRDSEKTTTFDRPGAGKYFYIYIPDGKIENGGEDGEDEVKTVYHHNTSPFPVPTTYPTGTLPYTCADPIEVISGSFVWAYSDLKILGKHAMEFTRHYDKTTGNSGSLGNGWQNSFEFKLNVNDKFAYFTLPTGEGIPFVFDENSNTFQPSSNLQTDYTMGFSTENMQTIMGTSSLYTGDALTSEPYILKGSIVPKTTNTSGGGIEIDDDTKTSGGSINIGDETITTGKALSLSSTIPFSFQAFTANEEPTNEKSSDYEEFTIETDDGEEMLVTMEKIPYKTNKRKAKNIVTNTFSPEGKTFIIKHKDGTEYHFDTKQNITKVVQNNVVKYTYEYNNGLVSKVTGQYGASFNFKYNNGKIVEVSDSMNNCVTYHYDSKNNLISSTNPDGDNLYFNYDSNGNLVSITDFKGLVFVSNTYDNKNRVLTQHVTGRGDSSMSYNDIDKVNTFTDETGKQTRYYYDGVTVIKVEDEKGVVQNVFGNDAKVLEQTDELGRKVLFGYDDKGRQNKITYPDGTTKETVYNDNNYPVTEKYPDGTTTEYSYDSRNNLLSITDQNGNTEYNAYDSFDNLISHTDKKGNTTTYQYDDNQFLKTVTDPTGAITQYKYDSVGKLLQLTSPMGKTVSYEYSPAGKLLKTTDADGITTNFNPDENGLNHVVTDKMGNKQYSTFDTMNALTSQTDFMGNTTYYEYDAKGRLIKTTDPLNYSETKAYDTNNNIVSRKDKNGNTTFYEFDAAGQQTKITNPLGQSISYSYDNRGRVSVVTNSINAKTSYLYDPMGRVTKETDALGYVTSYTYDNVGNLLEKQDKNGNKTVYTYDKENNVTKIQSTDGSTTEFVYDRLNRLVKTIDSYNYTEQKVYDPDGKLTTTINKENNETKYEYDSSGRIKKEIYADGTFIECEYNANGKLIKRKDQAGGIYSYAYNANGQVTEITDPMGYKTKTEYNKRGEIYKTTDANGGVTTFEYDGVGNLKKKISAINGVSEKIYDATNRLISEKDELGQTTSYTYDASGNMLTRTDPNGNTMTFTYNLLNQNTEIKDPIGNKVIMEYDPMGNLKSVTDEEGAQTFYSYDTMGNLSTIKNTLGNTLTQTHDLLGRVVERKNENGAITKMEYTPTGNVKRVTNSLGDVIEFTYDAMGRRISEKKPNGSITTYTYNPLGQVLTKTNNQGQTQTFTYDEISRIKTITDELNNVEKYEYDANSNMIKKTDANGAVTEYTYDALNNLTAIIINRTDSLNGINEKQQTIYKYNAKSQVIEEVNAIGKVKLFSYDANGNIIAQTDEDGYTTRNTYNELNRLATTTYADGKNIVYRYNKKGELIEFTDWNGTTSIKLDAIGRLQEVKDHNNRTVSYTYDAVGNKTSMVYPDNTKINYQYDSENQLIKVTDNDGLTTTFKYDANGMQTLQVNPNGEKTQFTYNDLGQKILASELLNETIRQTNEYFYDATGNLIKDIQTHKTYKPLSNIKEYKYDRANRLVEVEEKTYQSAISKDYDLITKRSYTYDTAGNLTNETENGATTVYSYNTLNQLITKQDANNLYSYQYDYRGNLISETKNGETQKEYKFDATNRMVEGNNNATGETSSYIFNALGKRISIEQKIINPNAKYQNNKNSGGNGYENFVNILANEDISEEIQGSYEDNFGLTRQSSKYSITKKEYVIDYTSPISNEIMLYENDTYITQYVYDDGNNKIFQKTTGLQEEVVNEGEAQGKTKEQRVNGIIPDYANRKIYFHKNRLSSTAYVTNELGNTLYFTEYDEWGNITSEKETDMNFIGLENAMNYTGHSYDVVIDKFYAQARFYDAENRRFISDDPIKDGVNWYVYCANNPIMYKDENGLAPSSFQYEEGVRKANELAMYLDMLLQLQAEAVLYANAPNGALRVSELHIQANQIRGKIQENADSFYSPLSPHFTLEYPLSLRKLIFEITSYESRVEGGKGSAIRQAFSEVGGQAIQWKKDAEEQRKQEELDRINLAVSIVTGAAGLLGRAGSALSSASQSSRYFSSAVNCTDDAFKGVVNVIDDFDDAFKGAANAFDDVDDIAKGASKGVATPKSVPNPNGKTGGVAHQNTIQKTADTLRQGGYDVTFEKYVPTTGGTKSARYGDILATDPVTGEQWIIQVGKQTQAGNPISREIKAIKDLMDAGWKVLFVPYN